MSVWLVLPSARPAEECEPVFEAWRQRGYKLAIWRDDVATFRTASATIFGGGKYPGYPQAINELIAYVIHGHSDADWFVAASDDTWPERNLSAIEIARECSRYFTDTEERRELARGTHIKQVDPVLWTTYSTFGVMQPTGDEWSDPQGRIIERIAGSPWIGREFAKRINRGLGPLWYEYFHNWADEELQLVAQKYGVFWQRPDLTHYHDNPMRHGKPRAAHLAGWIDSDYTSKKPLFESRRAAGFPGSEPL